MYNKMSIPKFRRRKKVHTKMTFCKIDLRTFSKGTPIYLLTKHSIQNTVNFILIPSKQSKRYTSPLWQIQKAIAEIQKLRGITDKHPCKVKKNISQHLHNDTSNSERRKRVRRTANEIARHYVCKVEKCQKSYGSEGSLNQHMKIKHHELVDQMTGLMMDK